MVQHRLKLINGGGYALLILLRISVMSTTTANISNGAPGQDYVLTAQDKSDIADLVLEQLPTTQGCSMATRVIDDSKLQNIAVAIQDKDGDGQMTVDEMPTRIEQNLQSKAVLDSVIDGSITSIESDVTDMRSNSFSSCTNLMSVSLPNVTSIGNYAFQGCRNLSIVILRKRATLSNSNAFSDSGNAITYVQPEDLSWYSTATNWSTLYAQDRIKSIEDLTGDDLVWYQEQLARYQAQTA